MNFDRIAVNNLENLSNFSKDKYINIVNKLTIDIKDKEEKYENLTDISDIEFAIYFTFHHILTSNNRYILNKYNRKTILNMIDDSIENLYSSFGRPNTNDDHVNKRFYYILEEIDMLSTRAFDNLNYYNCYYILNDWFHHLCSGFKAYHVISMDMNNILHGYINKNNNYSDSDSDSDSDSESESIKLVEPDSIKLVEPETPPPTDNYSYFSYFNTSNVNDKRQKIN